MTAQKGYIVGKVREYDIQYGGKPYKEVQVIDDKGIVRHRSRGATLQLCIQGLHKYGFTLQD